MDLAGVDLNLLTAFDALMAERSVTRAGTRLGRTQSATSATLARLRTLFDDELFLRTPRGLHPTPRALDLAGPIGRALAEISRTLGPASRFDPRTAAATVTIGLPDHPAFLLLPPLIDALGRDAPSLQLRIATFTHRDDATALLDSGRVDLAIGVPPGTPPGGRIRKATLFRDRFVSVVRRDHPVARRPLDLETFLGLSHLLVSPEGDRFGQVDAALASIGRTRHLAVTLPFMHAAPALVAQSDMIATLLRGAVEASGWARDLAILAPPLELAPVPFEMSWHRRNDAHPVQAWLRAAIERVARDLPGRNPGIAPEPAA